MPKVAEPLPTWPPVSIVMPIRNEARHLEQAVRRALDQDYPGEIEVVLAVAPSVDGTAAVVDRLRADDRRVRAVDNPGGTTPAGLNAALRFARYDVIARLDGHAIAPPSYLRTAVTLLRDTGAVNVGGVMAAEGTTPFEDAVACAMRSRFGVGSAAFHTGGSAGPADTVYLGVFRRAALEAVGGYDEGFDRAQDWELNYRLRQAGGTIWFSPELEVSYRPRASLRALAGQYFHYGRWRRVLTRRYPETVSMRYLAPPVTVVGVVGGSLLRLAGVRAAVLAPAGYVSLVAAATVATGRGLHRSALLRLPLVYATMHACWGIGFLSSPRALATLVTGPGRAPVQRTPPTTADPGNLGDSGERGELRQPGEQGQPAGPAELRQLDER